MPEFATTMTFQVVYRAKQTELTTGERQSVLRFAKQAVIPVEGTLGFKKAEVTAGGIALDEIESKTMQSKETPGLFFAGEVLDIDGITGGFNFQSAWTTGRIAGESISAFCST